jgi:hypothetical protein
MMIGPLPLRFHTTAAKYFAGNPSLPERQQLLDFFGALALRPQACEGRHLVGELWALHIHNHIVYVRMPSSSGPYGVVHSVHRDVTSQALHGATSRSRPPPRPHQENAPRSHDKGGTLYTAAPQSPTASEKAITDSASVVAISAAAAGVVNVIRNIIGGVKDSFDIKKHLREGDKRDKEKTQIKI